MSMSKKKSKITNTKVYYHSKKTGRIAIRLIGKYLYDFGFVEGDLLSIVIEEGKILVCNNRRLLEK